VSRAWHRSARRTDQHTPRPLPEFLNYKAKPTRSANETLEAGRENARDDIVLAIALAAWIGERQMVWLWVSV
jgi:hypothetical protein